MDFHALRTFTKVAELSSFTRAAEHLGLPKGRVSALVQQLEAQLGTRLLQRTTRRVHLTPDGEQFLARCQHLLGDVDELQALFRASPVALRGRLRVDLPVAIARDIVIPRLPELLAAHPHLQLELSTTDRRVDVLAEGFDCVLRVGTLPDSTLVARPLGAFPSVNLASPDYLRQHGEPKTLAGLDRHLLVHYSPAPGVVLGGWEYRDGSARGAWRQRPMRSAITVNSTDAYLAAALAGLGMVQLPAFGMQHLVASGRLVAVMPGFTAAPMPVSLLYPHRQHLAPRVEVFMGWLADVLAPVLA